VFADVAREGEQVGAGAVEVFGHGRQFLDQRVDDPVELGVHLVGLGLVEDRAEQREHPRWGFAISLTCDFNRPVMPSWATSFSTPGGYLEQ
jgi:hypothetical protein